MEHMNTSGTSTRKPGLGQILSASAVALGGSLAALYALNRLRQHSETQALLDTLPPRTYVGMEDNIAEPADDVYDPAGVARAATGRLEDLHFDQLYQLAQQHYIVGRASMGKSELIAALHAVKINPETK